jgi:hypothetical protein
MPSPNVIQLRQMLAEKFPSARTRPDLFEPAPGQWLTGLSRIDELLPGGFEKGTLSEIIAGAKGAGSASLIHALIHRAARENQIVVAIDGTDSLAVTQLGTGILSRLLWVRARSVEVALKAADVILRDPNLSLVLIDLAGSTVSELRKIPATTWYRFQRLVESTSMLCLVFTPYPMVTTARTRIRLSSPISLSALDQDFDELLGVIRVELAGLQHGSRLQSQGVA